jgi:RNA polymerase sigma-70 factor, ECF subfamily
VRRFPDMSVILQPAVSARRTAGSARGWKTTGKSVPFSEDIAAGVKAGDPDAVGAVYTVLAGRLLSYLMARVHDRPTAEDLLEATFIELIQRGDRIDGGPKAIKAWLFRAAHFNALDYLRSARRRIEDLEDGTEAFDVEDPDLGPEERAVVEEINITVRRAMERLSEDQRQVLFLRYMGGLTAPEVAEILGKSDGAVRSLQHRGERALARYLEAEMAAVASGPGESS